MRKIIRTYEKTKTCDKFKRNPFFTDTNNGHIKSSLWIWRSWKCLNRFCYFECSFRARVINNNCFHWMSKNGQDRSVKWKKDQNLIDRGNIETDRKLMLLTIFWRFQRIWSSSGCAFSNLTDAQCIFPSTASSINLNYCLISTSSNC